MVIWITTKVLYDSSLVSESWNGNPNHRRSLISQSSVWTYQQGCFIRYLVQVPKAFHRAKAQALARVKETQPGQVNVALLTNKST